MSVYVCIYIYLCMYMYIFMYVYVYIYVCMYVCMYIYIYIYVCLCIGQIDYKFMLYGNKDSGPLSLLLNIKPKGAEGMVCLNITVHIFIFEIYIYYVLCVFYRHMFARLGAPGVSSSRASGIYQKSIRSSILLH